MKNRAEIIRYIVNGIVATGVHFGVLTLNIELFEMASAGVANYIAALIAISVSFLGSRYFVFLKKTESIMSQAAKFGALYFAIALVHGGIMWLWADFFRFDYKVGFLFATCFQVACSYLGNKYLVFS